MTEDHLTGPHEPEADPPLYLRDCDPGDEADAGDDGAEQLAA
jgi:hypothetical protein